MDEGNKYLRPVVYQLLPRLFGNRNLTNKKNGSIEENGCGKFNDIGREALENIRNLGVTHIWYTGIIEHAHQSNYNQYSIVSDFPDVIKGKAGSPYAIKDYYDVDPDLAERIPERMREFEELVKRTHQSGLKVIIDLVPNHLARQYASDAKPSDVKDFGADDDSTKFFSPENNYYYLVGEEFVSPGSGKNEDSWHENPARATGNDVFIARPSLNDWYDTVKLNYGINYQSGETCFDPIPDTWLKMRDVVLYWARKGVDGFRCDMVGMVPVDFWKWLIGEVRKQYPSVLFLGEIYEPESYHKYIFEAGFDYLYDKAFFYNITRDILERKRPASDLSVCWQKTEGYQHHLLYFLENHDEQRVASDFFAGDAFLAVPAMVVAATLFHNSLLLYFGQELGEKGMYEEGFSGLDGRTSIFDYWGLPLIQKWSNKGLYDGGLLSDEAHELRSFYSILLAMVNSEPALNRGRFYDLMWSNSDNTAFDSTAFYAFFRYDNEQLLLIIANFSDLDIDYRLRIPRHFFELAGLPQRLYFTGHDKTGMNKAIQFPSEIAHHKGLGGRLRKYSASVYEMKYRMMER